MVLVLEGLVGWLVLSERDISGCIDFLRFLGDGWGWGERAFGWWMDGWMVWERKMV